MKVNHSFPLSNGKTRSVPKGVTIKQSVWKVHLPKPAPKPAPRPK